jgi:hypothetical protein
MKCIINFILLYYKTLIIFLNKNPINYENNE